MRKNVTLKLEAELEARPIALLVQTANRFGSKIYLETDGKRVNAKSIMGVMSLPLTSGESVVLDAEGEDAADAVEALEVFLRK